MLVTLPDVVKFAMPVYVLAIVPAAETVWETFARRTGVVRVCACAVGLAGENAW
ncbi:hypothetical protein [Amycolatopsis sp. WGS_07]|uniref:hypothetical protein n=1 Tax=Amycolatopsis sp. WGS_07 TaxID=3076764 RepID=UPI003872C056